MPARIEPGELGDAAKHDDRGNLGFERAGQFDHAAITGKPCLYQVGYIRPVLNEAQSGGEVPDSYSLVASDPQ